MSAPHVHEWIFVERNGAIKIWFCPACGQGKQRIATDVAAPLIEKYRAEKHTAKTSLMLAPTTEPENRNLLSWIFRS